MIAGLAGAALVRTPRLGAIAVTLIAAGASVVPGVAAASSPASGAAVKKLSLKVGDHILVKGASLACVVQSSGGILNFACVDGGLASPRPKSFAIGIADRGVDLAEMSPSGGSAKVISGTREPTISGAAFAVPSRQPKTYTVSPSSTALLIGGTHIFCAVQTTKGVINVTCGISTLADHLQFPTGTYIVSESAKFALIGKTVNGAFKTLAYKTQP